jgi:hypothetical protein
MQKRHRRLMMRAAALLLPARACREKSILPNNTPSLSPNQQTEHTMLLHALAGQLPALGHAAAAAAVGAMRHLGPAASRAAARGSSAPSSPHPQQHYNLQQARGMLWSVEREKGHTYKPTDEIINDKGAVLLLGVVVVGC